ncbi:hypothetical protein ScalyP_jg805 [Parmales sp. scaly parma]|nr:hypothetical protein ScalyP_jg805 [Parmales sp. scaly parma]
MLQFDPSGKKIWHSWRGTCFAETWASAIRNMLFATLIAFYFKQMPQTQGKLVGFGVLWGQLLSVTTFTLTFFLNVSYGLWRKCYEVSRRLQGRLNDLGLGLSIHAARTRPEKDAMSGYTPASRQCLELVARYVRVFNLLCYASFTRSHRPVLTPRGMRRLVERGLITKEEREALCNESVPATQRHNAVIMWIGRVFVEAKSAGHLLGGSGFEMAFLDKIHVIRAQYGAIGDELSGRMPFAYAHIVQVLVDVVLWLYPVMAFSTNMSYSVGIAGTGLLTIFYQGILNLAKQFLDPYDNENYGQGDDPLCVDTLVAETNSGSLRWLNGFELQPFSSKQITDGTLTSSSSLLPEQGFSKQELSEKLEEDSQQFVTGSLEEFSAKADKLLEEANRELIETEAILKAEPMANSLDMEETEAASVLSGITDNEIDTILNNTQSEVEKINNKKEREKKVNPGEINDESSTEAKKQVAVLEAEKELIKILEANLEDEEVVEEVEEE